VDRWFESSLDLPTSGAFGQYFRLGSVAANHHPIGSMAAIGGKQTSNDRLAGTKTRYSAGFSVFLVAGAGLAFATSLLSYVGRLRRPRHEPAPLCGYAGSKLAHFQNRDRGSQRS